MPPATTSPTMADLMKSTFTGDTRGAFVAHHHAAAMELIQEARAHRVWLKKLALTNPGAGRFYGENLDLLMAEIGRHRASIRRAKAGNLASDRIAAYQASATSAKAA